MFAINDEALRSVGGCFDVGRAHCPAQDFPAITGGRVCRAISRNPFRLRLGKSTAAGKDSEGVVTIRRQLSWLAFVGICGLLVFADVAFAALFQIHVNGPPYRAISLSTNTIADYLLPSSCLLLTPLISS